MSKVKRLAGETIIYGVSTVLGRLLNWLLLPLFVRTLSLEENGYITLIYSIIAVVQVFLTFGFETGFFRFVKSDKYKIVFTTLLSFTSLIGLIFFLLVLIFQNELAYFINISNYKELVWIVALILIIDSITSLPFALLRYLEKSLKYALLKFLQVVIICTLNVILLIVFRESDDSFINKFISEKGLQNVFVANLIGSLVILILLGKTIFRNITKVDYDLFKKVFKYSYPIWFVGIFGMFNQNGDKILLKNFLNSDNSTEILGIYGANFKLGVLMAIFTQSFRLAFEPFFFKNREEVNIKESYSKILNYFVGFGMIIFLCVLFYLPLINIVLIEEYIEGNKIIPFVLLGQLFFGIYYSLSLWYKLADKTIFGLFFTITGALIGILGYIFLIPIFGYLGASIAGLACYLSMTILSYVFGNKYYPIPYNLKRILGYIFIGLFLYYISTIYSDIELVYKLSLNSVLLCLFCVYLVYKENLLKLIKRTDGSKNY